MHNKSRDPTEYSTQPRRALTLDVEKYQQMLDAPELTDEQREEFIRCIWGVLVAMMRLEIEVREAEVCGQDEFEMALSGLSNSDLVDLASPRLTTEFTPMAGAETPNGGE